MLKSYSTLLEDIKEKNSLRVFYLQNKLCSSMPIDIIMPVYNRENTIESSINSVLDQTHRNWSLYICDDGSSDGTGLICKKYSLNKKVFYHRFPDNKGVSKARNQCLRLGKSPFITYLDSDNLWRPDYLQTICAFMCKYNLECAYLGIKLFNEKGIQGCIGREFSWNECHLRNYIDINCFAHTRKALLAMNKNWGYNFDESISRLVDWDFILRMTKFSRIKFLNLYLAEYYCGTAMPRITNSFYTKNEELKSLIKYIQDKH